jgi:pimeloyl-ACP methyl ester carboxylesterase
MREVIFPSGRRELAGRLFEPVAGKAGGRAVLFVHGQGGSQNSYKHRAEVVSAELNATCLTFNLSVDPEDNDTNGVPVTDHLDEVISAFDFLTSRPAVDRTRVGVCGASYGGYLVALLSAHRSIRRLILRAPSLACDHFPTKRLATRRDTTYELDSLKALAAYGRETLIIQSERDEVIPESHILAYLGSNSRAEREQIREATHALTCPVWDEQFIRYIVSWFRQI